MKFSPYLIAKLFAQFVTNTFFRNVEIVGLENIPEVLNYYHFFFISLKDVPLLLYGNHNNQFLDPLLIIAHAKRQISFIGAAKSLRRPIIGEIGKALGTIPVERPQDLAKRGTGTISSIVDQKKLKGSQTRFLTEVNEGDSLLIQSLQGEFIITKILSDTEIEFKSDDKNIDIKFPLTFKVQPRVDQSLMFQSVWDALQQNRCVGIFPEGGSHDRVELLPLKAGICIMGLGAMQKYKKPVYLQPVRMSYFKPHQFRSKVIIEFGMATQIPENLVDLYGRNKREAVAILLKNVERQLVDLSVNVTSYTKLSDLYLTRSIYLPKYKQVSPKENLILLRRFSVGFTNLKDHPEVVELSYKIKLYSKKLRLLGINDYQVRTIQRKPWYDLLLFLYSFIMTIMCLIFALPGIIMNGPIVIALSILGERERKKALANSKVKIQGKDVVASYKIICAIVIVPISIIIYTFLFYLSIKDQPLVSDHAKLFSFIFFFLWPLYIMIMIRSNDGLYRHFRNAKAKLLFFFSQNTYEKVKKTREDLQKQIRKLVSIHYDTMNPEGQKIIQENEFDYQTLDERFHSIFECLQDLGI